VEAAFMGMSMEQLGLDLCVTAVALLVLALGRRRRAPRPGS